MRQTSLAKGRAAISRRNEPKDFAWSSKDEQRNFMEDMLMSTSKSAAMREAGEVLKKAARRADITPALLEVAQRHFGKDAVSRVNVSYVTIDKAVLRSMSYPIGSQKEMRIAVVLNDALSPKEQRDALEKELAHQSVQGGDTFWLRGIDELYSRPRCELKLDAVIVPKQKTSEGVLIQSVSIAWRSIIERLGLDWAHAYEIPPRIWEEIIAGAYPLLIARESKTTAHLCTSPSPARSCLRRCRCSKAYKRRLSHDGSSSRPR